MLSWTHDNTREPCGRIAYKISLAELGILAPVERLIFSAQKGFSDCKHTHKECRNKFRRQIINMVCVLLGIHKLSH